MSHIPANLLYTKDHEWILIEGDTATVGITDYAQTSLGDVTFADLPDVGDTFAQIHHHAEPRSHHHHGHAPHPSIGQFPSWEIHHQDSFGANSAGGEGGAAAGGWDGGPPNPRRSTSPIDICGAAAS